MVPSAEEDTMKRVYPKIRLFFLVGSTKSSFSGSSINTFQIKDGKDTPTKSYSNTNKMVFRRDKKIWWDLTRKNILKKTYETWYESNIYYRIVHQNIIYHESYRSSLSFSIGGQGLWSEFSDGKSTTYLDDEI